MIYPPFLINTFLLKRRAAMTKKTWEDEVFFIITIIFAIMIPYFKGGGRRPRRPGRTKFSQHSLSSRRKELTRTRQVVSVFIFMKTLPGHDNHDNHDNHDSHDNFPFSQLWPGTSGPGGKHKWLRRVGSGIDIDMMDTDICLIFMLQCFFRTFGNPTDPNCAQQNHNPLIQLS